MIYDAVFWNIFHDGGLLQAQIYYKGASFFPQIEIKQKPGKPRAYSWPSLNSSSTWFIFSTLLLPGQKIPSNPQSPIKYYKIRRE